MRSHSGPIRISYGQTQKNGQTYRQTDSQSGN